uniref:Uncharacterized protein n=1 Tax=Meloidogyne enterolobii TaxID=390850 RepID=A0A6V7XUK3_MELEN|nr:unnamed protein product [Meloidogyne enterolobii]
MVSVIQILYIFSFLCFSFSSKNFSNRWSGIRRSMGPRRASFSS